MDIQININIRQRINYGKGDRKQQRVRLDDANTSSVQSSIDNKKRLLGAPSDKSQKGGSVKDLNSNADASVAQSGKSGSALPNASLAANNQRGLREIFLTTSPSRAASDVNSAAPSNNQSKALSTASAVSNNQLQSGARPNREAGPSIKPENASRSFTEGPAGKSGKDRNGELVGGLKDASIRSIAQALNIELGSLIDSSEIFDLREGYIRHELGTEKIVLKIYYKNRLSQGRFEEIRQFHHQRIRSERTLPLTPDVKDLKETEDFLIVYISSVDHSLLREWQNLNSMHLNNAQREKVMAKWVVELLNIMSKYWYEDFFFEFISPNHTFLMDRKKIVVGDFYGCTFLSEDKNIVRQKNENYDPVLIPPEFAKGKLNLENAGFDDIDAFIPSMIWLSAAQVLYFATGSPPTYDQIGEKFNLVLPSITNKYSRHFLSFINQCLDHEMENRLADFDQVMKSRWVRNNYGRVTVPTVEQMRDQYKKTIMERFPPQSGSTPAQTAHKSSPVHPPRHRQHKNVPPSKSISVSTKTRIFYCRRPAANWDKSEFEECRIEFREIQQELLAPFKFEQQIEEGSYKGLIRDQREALLDPRFNATRLPRLHKRKLTLTKKHRNLSTLHSRSGQISDVSKSSYEVGSADLRT